jgi:predicted MarR family transcription regulator
MTSHNCETRGIARPTVTPAGRRACALRFGDSRVQALAGALCVTVGAVTGITNRSLCALMTGLLGVSYGMTQASYDLARLRHNGLLSRRPHTNTYDLTSEGLRFAIFYTKVHDRVLAPLFASDQPQAPPDLRAALRTLDEHITDRLAQVRLPAAA